MYFENVYKALYSVYKDGAFIASVIDGIPDDRDKSLSVRIIYGVLEKDVELEKIIKILCECAPDFKIRIVLKIGIYCLKYMNSLPDYAVVNNAVELVKTIGKRQVAGFVNAVLKRYVKDGADISKNNDSEEIEYSLPKWYIDKIKSDYKDDAEKLLNYVCKPREHIRLNMRKISYEEFKSAVRNVESSKFGGYYVKATNVTKKLFERGEITYQAEGSMAIAQAVANLKPKSVLDMCAAPGGKSAYIDELINADIIACDIREHRVKLIESYIKRMGSKHITALVADGTVNNAEWNKKFDVVLIDAPCSGSGVIYSKPDIMLKLNEQGIKSLTEIQSKLLDNGARYVSDNGYIVYSTCSVLKDENERQVKAFIEQNGDFEFVKDRRVLPHVDDTEGFYYAIIKRK